MTAQELELKKAEEELKNAKFNRRLSLIKWITMVFGTIILFIIIQRPESLLNRKSSQESINRERAKIVLNLIKNKQNPNDVLLGLAVLEKSYPEKENDWVKEMIEIFKVKAETQSDFKLQESRIRLLRNKLDSLQLDVARKNATDWNSYQAIRDSISIVNRNIEKEKTLIDLFLKDN